MPSDLTTARHRRKPVVRSPARRGLRFVETKLQPPAVRDEIVPRERLLQILARAVGASPLTLVSAPAGYGKTTLLASIGRVATNASIAWLSIDEDDNDPNVFAAALVASLRRVDSHIGADAAELLPSVAGVGRAILDPLINDVVSLHPNPLVVVLDDFHRVTEPTVAKAIEYLIDRMPPQMRIVVGTRHDPQLPLPRLRARQQVAEIRIDELRFLEDESRELFNGTFHLGLTADNVALLQQRTEGWPAGLSLLVGALRRLPAAHDRDTFLTQLVQLDRYVFEYLAAEIFDTLAPEVRQFLLDVSVLEELSHETCAIVAQREDAGAMLQDLYARNLFVTPVDEPPVLFRFHDLFRDFLQHRLRRDQPDRIAELHRRAGWAERTFSRAVNHFLAARAWDEVAGLLEKRGEETLRDGALATLCAWIAALPRHVVDAHPYLSFLLGVAAWTRFDLAAALPNLERAVEGFRAQHDRRRLGPALVHLSNVLGAIGDFERANAITTEARSYDLPLGSRLGLLIQETWFDMAGGECDRASEAFDAALDLVEARGAPSLVHGLARSIHLYLFGLPNATPRIERFVRIASPHMRAGSPLRAAALTVHAWALQWRGAMSEADTAARDAMNLAAQLGGLRSATTEAGLLRATLAVLRRDDRTADAMLDLLFDELRALAPFADAWMSGYLIALGRLRLMQGRLDDARAAEQRIRRIENLREWPIAPVARAFFRGLIEHAEGNDISAEASLRTAVELQKRVHVDYFAGDARVALAMLMYRNGNTEQALKTFTPVLARHDRYGTPGAIVWEGAAVKPLLRLARERKLHAPFASTVLRLWGEVVDDDAAIVTASGEPLTAREAEVLRLVAEGASNAAIAEKLVISVHTVKRHVANVLQKLRASSRAEAGAMARRMRIT
jgi:LuxR family maltose regulon positive regulatory protein